MMGYPKKYVGHYPQLARWLASLGHIVYPYEMLCKPVPVKDKKPAWTRKLRSGTYIHYKTHFLYGNVDVASRFQGKLYAWEYKSENDNILRALKQAKNYARSFDYVVVVVEDLSQADRHVRAKGKYVKTILCEFGVGIAWNDEGNFDMVFSPKLQNPDPKLNEQLQLRFSKFLGSQITLAASENSRKLMEFF